MVVVLGLDVYFGVDYCVVVGWCFEFGDVVLVVDLFDFVVYVDFGCFDG